MTLKIVVASLVVSLLAGILAQLVGLHSLLSAYPAFLVHFIVALPAALLACLWVNRGTSAAAPRRQAPRPAASAPPSTRKETGSVKWFSPNKGFGFITRDNGEDIFVHFRSIMGEGHRVLREGQRVEFAVTEGTKGLQAENVCALK